MPCNRNYKRNWPSHSPALLINCSNMCQSNHSSSIESSNTTKYKNTVESILNYTYTHTKHPISFAVNLLLIINLLFSKLLFDFLLVCKLISFHLLCEARFLCGRSSDGIRARSLSRSQNIVKLCEKLFCDDVFVKIL